MTEMQSKLIEFIEAHGHWAYVHRDGSRLVAISNDQYGKRWAERIPATWQAVRDWLGY